MRTDFTMLGQTLMGPRACGRTYGLITGAPKGATLLASHSDHADFLRRAAKEQNRDDLKISVADPVSLRGCRGPFLPDHLTVERWLYAAGSEIGRLRSALADARDALRNDFEPDNQSAAYKRADAALKE